jgi:hydrogenase maturation protease
VSRPLVIGIGNPTRSDDGVGRTVVSELSRRVPWVNYRAVHQLTPDLAEDIAEASLVVFVDASVRATALTVTPVVRTEMTAGSHLTSAGALLHLTEMTYGRRPEVTLQVEIPAYELGFGEELSPATAAWAERAIVMVADHLCRGDGMEVLGAR